MTFFFGPVGTSHLGHNRSWAIAAKSSYSITSSARASSVGGTVMPIGRLGAIENLVDIECALVSQCEIIRTIRHQCSEEGPSRVRAGKRFLIAISGIDLERAIDESVGPLQV